MKSGDERITILSIMKMKVDLMSQWQEIRKIELQERTLDMQEKTAKEMKERLDATMRMFKMKVCDKCGTLFIQQDQELTCSVKCTEALKTEADAKPIIEAIKKIKPEDIFTVPN